MARARVRVRLSAKCTGRIVLCLHLGSGSNVRTIVRSSYCVTMRQG